MLHVHCIVRYHDCCITNALTLLIHFPDRRQYEPIVFSPLADMAHIDINSSYLGYKENQEMS